MLEIYLQIQMTYNNKCVCIQLYATDIHTYVSIVTFSRQDVVHLYICIIN